jgi:WW domain-binding protein 2
MRMVFVADKPGADPDALTAVDLPLVYIRADKFNQPIFGCNNLAGECWPVAADGGPNGTRPPHKYALFFREGGVGTFLPLYCNFIALARAAEVDRRKRDELNSESAAFDTMKHALVDPNDPTRLYLTQPVGEDARLSEAPVYAANYGADEEYEPLI